MDLLRAKAEWELQELYEDLVIARAHVVRVIRDIRAVVREPRNRTADRRRGRVPYYTDPEDAIAALRNFRHLGYLIHPGRRNRIKPDVLLARYEKAVAVVDDLTRKADEAEMALASFYLNDQSPGGSPEAVRKR